MELPAPSAVNADPLLLGVTLAAALLVGWFIRRSREPRAARRRRAWLLSAAVLLLLAIWFSPVAVIAQHYLLSAHLLQVTIVMGAVPPLLLLALPRDARRVLPRPVNRLLRLVVHPLFAIAAVNAAFFGWHITEPYGAAMANSWLYAAEQLSLLLTSIAFWWPIITPLSPPVRAMTPLGKMGYILLATIPQTFGGLAVALAHHVLYPAYTAAPRLFGLDPLTDQQIAGASIALVSKIALFTAFIVIFLHALGSEGEPEDGDSGDGGIHPVIEPKPMPSGTPQWLLDVARGRTVAEPEVHRRPRVKEPAGSGPRRA